MMIVVAFVALYLGISIHWARSRRNHFFLGRASLHASLEASARDSERRFLQWIKELEPAEQRLRDSDGFPVLPQVASEEPARAALNQRVATTRRGMEARYRQGAAKAAAKADYHAAMRRKYEEAAARRWLTVEPDPPEPPWP